MNELIFVQEATARIGFFEIFAIALSGFYALVKSYGIAIILLTLAVRLLLLPLSIKQTRSMREMQVIQPEVKKLQTKYKGDRQKMNEELMKLYKEHGVNPFGGCLPLLMQFPVLIGLFYVIRTPLKYMGYTSSEGSGGLTNWEAISGNLPGILQQVQDSALARGLDTAALEVNRFVGLRLDCSPSMVLGGQQSDTVATACGSGLLSFLPYLILILGMGYTTYYQQKQMQARQDGSQQNQQMQQMQTFMKIMPFMLMFFSFQFPTGVVLYWLTTNLWTIVQQRIILKAAPPLTLGKGEGDSPKEKEKAEKPSKTDKVKGQPSKGKNISGSPAEKQKAPTPRGGGTRSKKKKRKR